jgi:succinate-acetate transporter protein
MPMVAGGSIAFALAVSGYVPVGALVPILVVAVIGEIVAARWAYRDGQTDFGRIFIAFAGFWLTYVGLVLGLSHGWFGVAPEESTMAIVLFMITWLTVMILVTLANLEMPLVLTLTLLALDVALVLLVIGTIVGMDMLFSAATTALLISAALAGYACVATTGPAALRRILPVGAAVLRRSAPITVGEDDYAAVPRMREPTAQHSEEKVGVS